jgi:hypothetical protein
VANPQPLTIRAPSRGTAVVLAEKLSDFAETKLTDGQVHGCGVEVSDPSSDVFNRTLSTVSTWLEESGLASVEVEFDGSRYVVDAKTPARLGLDVA